VIDSYRKEGKGMLKNGLSARQRIRDLVAENRRLTGENKRLTERIRRMERSFEEVQQICDQYRVDLTINDWQKRRSVQQQFIEFVLAVVPAGQNLERRIAEAAADARGHHIRSFFKRLIHHTRVNRPESP